LENKSMSQSTGASKVDPLVKVLMEVKSLESSAELVVHTAEAKAPELALVHKLSELGVNALTGVKSKLVAELVVTFSKYIHNCLVSVANDEESVGKCALPQRCCPIALGSSDKSQDNNSTVRAFHAQGGCKHSWSCKKKARLVGTNPAAQVDNGTGSVHFEPRRPGHEQEHVWPSVGVVSENRCRHTQPAVLQSTALPQVMAGGTNKQNCHS
jgi:hypothetical protein